VGRCTEGRFEEVVGGAGVKTQLARYESKCDRLENKVRMLEGDE